VVKEFAGEKKRRGKVTYGMFRAVHEQRVARIIRERKPKKAVCISAHGENCDLMPEREASGAERSKGR